MRHLYFLPPLPSRPILKTAISLGNNRFSSDGTPRAFYGTIMKQLTKSSSLKWKVALVALLLQTTASVSMATGANTNSQNSAGNWTAKSDTAGQPGNSEQATQKTLTDSLKQFLKTNVKSNPEFASGINLGEYEADEIINWLSDNPDFLTEVLSHVESDRLESLNWGKVYKAWRAWALEDSDNDGMTNGDELLALTDPDDAASSLVLELTTSHGKGSVKNSDPTIDYVSWDAQPGCTYAVEACTDLLSSEWTVIAEGLTEDHKKTIELGLPTGNSRVYYRLQVSR